MISFFGDTASKLGESPLWDARTGRLWWVDITRRRLLAADAHGALLFEREYDMPICSIGLAREGLVAALADGFALIDRAGGVRRLASPNIGPGAIRFNDGKMDRQGRFLSGTMQHGGQEEPLATVWQLSGGHARRIESGLKLTNSICFSPDGRWLYLSDTLEAVIRRYPYDPATGALGVREDFFDCNAIGAHPDGATVDTLGRIWVALVTSQEIGCISPDGRLLDRIALPIPYPACPAFGGADMDVLYVTTISDSGHKLKSEHPDAGRILAMTGLGATGIPEAVFAA